MRHWRRATLVLLVLLMPLRGTAAGFMQMPSAGTHGDAMHQMAAAGDMSCCDHEEDGQNQGTSCEQHDCCAAFLAAAPSGAMPALAGDALVPTRVRFFAGFVPEHLDPPPLAL